MAELIRPLFGSNRAFLNTYNDHIDGLSAILGFNSLVKVDFFINNKSLILTQFKKLSTSGFSQGNAEDDSVVKFIAQEVIQNNNVDAVAAAIYSRKRLYQPLSDKSNQIITEISDFIMYGILVDFDHFMATKCKPVAVDLAVKESGND